MSQSSLLTRSILGMFAVVSMVDTSSATTILDAYADSDRLDRLYGIIAIDGDRESIIAQTFTPTVTGKLAGIAIRAYKSGTPVTKPLVVKILSTSDGVPSDFSSGTLGSVTLQPESVPHHSYDETGATLNIWTYVDFSSFNILVLANQPMAISLQSSTPYYGLYIWHTSNSGDIYEGGQRWTKGGNLFGPWGASTLHPGDNSFQTFITIPEPPAAALTSLAALGFVRLRRVRRRAMA